MPARLPAPGPRPAGVTADDRDSCRNDQIRRQPQRVAGFEDQFDNRNGKATKAFPPKLRRAARRKLQYLHVAADLRDLKAPPGNRLEGLKGDLKGFHSIRINDQRRVVFRWSGGNAFDVQVVDYD